MTTENILKLLENMRDRAANIKEAAEKSHPADSMSSMPSADANTYTSEDGPRGSENTEDIKSEHGESAVDSYEDGFIGKAVTDREADNVQEGEEIKGNVPEATTSVKKPTESVGHITDKAFDDKTAEFNKLSNQIMELLLKAAEDVEDTPAETVELANEAPADVEPVADAAEEAEEKEEEKEEEPAKEEVEAQKEAMLAMVKQVKQSAYSDAAEFVHFLAGYIKRAEGLVPPEDEALMPPEVAMEGGGEEMDPAMIEEIAAQLIAMGVSPEEIENLSPEELLAILDQLTGAQGGEAAPLDALA